MKQYITELPEANRNGTPLEKLACHNFPPMDIVISAINYAVERACDLKPFEDLHAQWKREIAELTVRGERHGYVRLDIMGSYAAQLSRAIATAHFIAGTTFRVGDEVEVSDNGTAWGTAYYAYTNPTGGHWVALTKHHIDLPQHLISYQHIRRVEPPAEVTLQELLDKYEEVTGTKVKVKP